MKRPLLILWIGLVLGETCGNLFHEMGFMIPASLFLFLFLCFMIWHGKAKGRNRIWKPFFISVICVTMSMFVGVVSWNMELKKIKKAIQITNTFQNGECVVRGKVLEHKKSESGYSTILLKNMSIKSEEKDHFRKLSGKGKFVGKSADVQKAGNVQGISPGDQVEFLVAMQQIEGPRNPGGFDEKKYSYANGIYYSGFFSSARIIVRPRYSLLSILDTWKNQIEEGYFKSAPKKEAAFLCAMVLGDKTYLTEEQKKLYEENGVSHMLAISGLHVSMVGGKLYRSLRKKGCGYTSSCLFGGCVLLFHGAMTGFRTSAVRAIVMYLMFLTAEYTGMPYDMISAMSFSGMLMILEHPYRLIEGGFLISYASILAIGGVLPFVLRIFWEEEDLAKLSAGEEERHGKRFRKSSGNWIQRGKQALVSSAVISAAALPLILRFYYECSPYSILLNPCILPFMSTLMTSGIMTGLGIAFSEFLGKLGIFLTIVFPGIQKIICYPAVLILKGYDRILSLFHKFPGSLWVTGCFPIWKVFLLYVFEGSFILLLYKKRDFFRKKPWIRRGTMFITITVCVLLIYGKSQTLRITMLDVGQGDCILFRLPGGQNVLIDGGSTSKKEVFKNIMEPAFRYYGITKLDYVVATHMDEDHISGIEEMLENGYPVKNLLVSDVSKKDSSKTYKRMIKYAAENRTKVQTMSRGTSLKIAGIIFYCLHPGKDVSYPDENAASVVIYVKYHHFGGLFTGDLEMEQEENLTFPKDDLPITLLKVAHHGSKYSTGKEFLQKIQPKYAILSAGKGNRYGHPHEELLCRLKEQDVEIHQTVEEGAIVIETDGENTVVQ